MTDRRGSDGSVLDSSRPDRTSVTNYLLTNTSTSSDARGYRARQIFQEIYGMQSRKAPKRLRSWAGLREGEETPPVPPQFGRNIDTDKTMSSPVKRYHRRITRGDDGRGPGGLGWRSPVLELLQKDTMARASGRPRIQWTRIKKVHEQGDRRIEVWEMSSADGNEVRRLNLVLWKEVLIVI